MHHQQLISTPGGILSVSSTPHGQAHSPFNRAQRVTCIESVDGGVIFSLKAKMSPELPAGIRQPHRQRGWMTIEAPFSRLMRAAICTRSRSSRGG